MPTLSKTANKNSLLALFVVLYYYYIGISEAAIIKKSSSDNEPTVTFGSLESDMMDNLIAQKHSETGNEIKQSYPDVRSTWLSQPVDHFNKTDKRVFDQHYMYNIKFKSKSGVAFLKIGGTKEISDIELGVASRPFLIWARKYGAACFFLEHRFFGKSQPFNDISVESYKYLTIEQVMADMRRFIIEMNKIFFVNVAKPRWIIFGCSYTGALAAWFRATNEDLTSAAIASSSVIQARVDNFDYVWNEENILKKENPKCSEAVRLGMQEIISKLYTLNGRKYVKKLFNTCKEFPEPPRPKTLQFFLYQIMNTFGIAMQYSGGSSPIRNSEICAVMLSKNETSYAEKIGYVMNLYYTKQNWTSCWSIDEISYWKALKNSSLNSSFAEYRTWLWLRCTAVGLFLTTNIGNSIFGSSLPIDYHIDICMATFGDQYNADYIHSSIKKTLLKYGGNNNYSGSRTLFINSSNDPWKSLSCLNCNSTAREVYSVTVEDGYHCCDVSNVKKSDSTSLTNIRSFIDEKLNSFITES